jgi:hypothetical protein
LKAASPFQPLIDIWNGGERFSGISRTALPLYGVACMPRIAPQVVL